MELTLLKAKLHRACATHAELDYEGSCGIDADLLAAAGIVPYEQVDIYNVTNGERLSTYAIAADAGSRIISANGAAAHKIRPGDRLIICAYARMSQAEAEQHKPRLVYLDADNAVTHTRHAIPSQAA